MRNTETPILGGLPDPVILDQSKMDIAHKYISNPAFLLIASQMIEQGKPFSVVRQGDGEKMIIRGNGILNNEWGKIRGCISPQGAVIPKETLAGELVSAGNRTTYFAPSFHGLWMPHFDMFSLFNPRDHYVDGLYTAWWALVGYSKELLKIGKVFIVCRDWQAVAGRLSQVNGLVPGHIVGSELDSWMDRERVISEATGTDAVMILVAGGPPGKILTVELAEKCGKPALDIGNDLCNRW